MKEDVGMSKPKKHANNVRWDPKLNKPLYIVVPCYHSHFSIYTCFTNLVSIVFFS